MHAKIALIPGDGIGPEVVAEGAKVLNAVGEKFGHTFAFLGGL
jgi:3-isopropylmalate dehydrogenase